MHKNLILAACFESLIGPGFSSERVFNKASIDSSHQKTKTAGQHLRPTAAVPSFK